MGAARQDCCHFSAFGEHYNKHCALRPTPPSLSLSCVSLACSDLAHCSSHCITSPTFSASLPQLHAWHIRSLRRLRYVQRARQRARQHECDALAHYAFSHMVDMVVMVAMVDTANTWTDILGRLAEFERLHRIRFVSSCCDLVPCCAHAICPCDMPMRYAHRRSTGIHEAINSDEIFVVITSI